MKNKLLLLCGPSGSGKSTIARMLISIDKRFMYVPVLTTRDLRPDEIGKSERIHISLEELNSLNDNGELLNFDHPYGDAYYGIRKETIGNMLSEGIFPVIDWPTQRIDFMRSFYPVFAVILVTTKIETILTRISDGRDMTGKRGVKVIEELNELKKWGKSSDALIVNHENNLSSTMNIIYNRYIYFVNN